VAKQGDVAEKAEKHQADLKEINKEAIRLTEQRLSLFFGILFLKG